MMTVVLFSLKTEDHCKFSSWLRSGTGGSGVYPDLETSLPIDTPEVLLCS